MRVFIVFFITLVNTTLLLAQSPNGDKERYAILEAALIADDAVKLSSVIDNDRLLAITEGLKRFSTVDTTIAFDDKTTTHLISQLETSTIKRWDKKNVYRFEIADRDPFTGIDTNSKLDSAHQKYMNKIVRLQRASLPLFTDQQSAFVLLSGKVVTFQDGTPILNSNYTKVYFLRLHKKRWKVTKSLLLTAN
ncbi:hypothetical protein [Pseudochryseolinea flava]|uniref:Uncharacterized protein n=1 Tax=Pseudochryseolinea flava TaxID=2059302 RepID=A0A364XZ80_9BACT|nr:hypothetical protein [Pseudochryseolinea flava]RAV99831.1 hypothetical protein DQQ10_17470 [Pseudochryseolinea flava]